MQRFKQEHQTQKVFARAGKAGHLSTREPLHPARGRPRRGHINNSEGRRQEEASPNGKKPQKGGEAWLGASTQRAAAMGR